MEKKQSSIDILMKAILESDVELYISMQESGEFEQIKAMHEEEIQSAIIYAECEHNILGNVWPTQTALDKAEKYYNETFGGNNE